MGGGLPHWRGFCYHSQLAEWVDEGQNASWLNRSGKGSEIGVMA